MTKFSKTEQSKTEQSKTEPSTSVDTQTIHGIKACLAVFDHRPHDILRIFYRAEVAKQLGVMLRWAATRQIVYRELDEEGMRKVAKSAHHEGLVLVTQPLRYGEFELAGKGGSRPPMERWMALDGVENPHNQGAILRTAAFYGLEGLLAGGAAPASRVNSAALRVAEGGAEFLQLCATEELVPVLLQLVQDGWNVIGLETGAPPLPPGNLGPPPWMLVVGHEQEGLSREVRAACGAVYSIAGEGRLGSLNVSVATGVALSRLAAQPQLSMRSPGPPRLSRLAGRPPETPERPARSPQSSRPAPQPRQAPKRLARPSAPPSRRDGGGGGAVRRKKRPPRPKNSN